MSDETALADKIENWSPDSRQPLTLIARERRQIVAALRATSQTPDAVCQRRPFEEDCDKCGHVGIGTCCATPSASAGPQDEIDYIGPTDITTTQAALTVAAWYWSEARKYRSGHYQNVTEAAFPLEHAAKALEALRIYLPSTLPPSRGSSVCPVCGKDTPHTHSQDEVMASSGPQAEAVWMELLRAAKQMPRATPACGGAGTEHPFTIEAAKVWDLDRAIKAVEAHPQPQQDIPMTNNNSEIIAEVEAKRAQTASHKSSPPKADDTP